MSKNVFKTLALVGAIALSSVVLTNCGGGSGSNTENKAMSTDGILGSFPQKYYDCIDGINTARADMAVGTEEEYKAAKAKLAELQEKLEARPRRELPHTPQPGAGALNRSTLDIPNELLRSRYCIKWELGLCPKQHPSRSLKEPLYLVNQKNRLRLQFDCRNCEMVVTV